MTCSPIKLPYYAPHLPSSLPTAAEVDTAPDISPEISGRRIVAVGEHYVVKFGLQVNLIEGENMLFVQESTETPIPKVYALYSDPGTRMNYIVMERIQGQTLLSLWLDLTTSEKESVVTTLREYFHELRRLPSPNYYGSLGRRPPLDEVFWTPGSDPQHGINGPFDSNEAVIEAMVRKYIYDGGLPYRAEFYRLCLPRGLPDRDGPTFTHGDFQRKNIMIRTHPGVPLTMRNLTSLIVVLDWEKSG